MNFFNHNAKEKTVGGNKLSADRLKKVTERFTDEMTPIEKKATFVCAIIALIAVVFCFIVTFSAIHTLCLFAFFLTVGVLLRIIRRVNAKKCTYRSKTWSVYFIMMIVAVTFLYSVYNFDRDINFFNLITKAKTIDTYEEAVDAAGNNCYNTVMSIDETDLVSTDFGYNVQIFKGGSLMESKRLYSYYLFRFDGRFVLLKADSDYLRSYFDKKKSNGDTLTRVYISEYDRADAGTYDSIYTPASLIYPYDGREVADIEDDDDYFSSVHKQYLKFHSDIELYELSEGFVVTIKEYDLNKQKTLVIAFAVFSLLILNAVVSVILHPKKVTEAQEETKEETKKETKNKNK